jgi:hypothetical protein
VSLTQAAYSSLVVTAYLRKDLITDVNNTSGKFSASVNDTGGQAATSVFDTSGAP